MSLGKAVIAALVTGLLGFAAGLSIDRGAAPPEPASTPQSAAIAAGRPDMAPPEAALTSGAGSGDAPVKPPSPRATSATSAGSGGGGRTPGAGSGQAGRGAKGTIAPGAGAAPAESGSGSALAAELALLREVQSALKEGDSLRAERWIDEHAARYPDGVLREEREAASVLLLCAKGHVAEARAAAERFLKSNPRSVQADRVRGSCAFTEKRVAP